MTKKHFEMVARILSETYRKPNLSKVSPEAAIMEIAEEFADAFIAENPRFDRERFMRAVKGERTALDKTRARM